MSHKIQERDQSGQCSCGTLPTNITDHNLTIKDLENGQVYCAKDLTLTELERLCEQYREALTLLEIQREAFVQQALNLNLEPCTDQDIIDMFEEEDGSNMFVE